MSGQPSPYPFGFVGGTVVSGLPVHAPSVTSSSGWSGPSASTRS